MPTLGKHGMKLLKILHLLAASCWIGGALALAVLNRLNADATSDAMLYGINAAGHAVDMSVVVIGGAMGCLGTGLVYSLFTGWGFSKHRFVVAKWLITLWGIFFGTFYLGVWEGLMVQMSQAHGLSAWGNVVFTATVFKHFAGGLAQLALLLLAVVLSVYKPWGRTRG